MGSPPRMRGKEDKKEPLCGSFGITPAYAGKSDAACIHGAVVGDHPRVCGEKRLFPLAAQRSAGSPPRMRGKATFPSRRPAFRRITPAYAGKSYHSRYFLLVVRDHPRVCGEKARTLLIQDEPQGSPPRMRGKEICVAKSRPSAQDHPRVCGEKLVLVLLVCIRIGSPPRMRGKVPV